MNKYLFKISVTLIFIAISVLFLHKVHKPYTVNKFSTAEKELKIINLGDSHGSSFTYENLPISGNCYNKKSNTIYYDLQNYKYLKNKLAQEAIIVLPISYFSFGLDENRTDLGINNSFLNDFYEYLPTGYIHSYSLKKHVKVFLFRIQQNFFQLLLNKPEEKIDDQITITKDLKGHAYKRASHHKEISNYSDPQKNIEYISQLIHDAQKSGFKPILVTTPFYKDYNYQFESDWLRDHYFKHMNHLSNQFNIPYLDYGNDSRFSDKSTYFYNSDHLSQHGTIEFSNIFFNDLKSMGILEVEY